jgi:hypothetical protein
MCISIVIALHPILISIKRLLLPHISIPGNKNLMYLNKQFNNLLLSAIIAILIKPITFIINLILNRNETQISQIEQNRS